jgi:flagellar hook-associated protein 1 FlgK
MADLLSIGLSALLAQQRALATTGNNIANASTPGYSRQRVELTSRPTEQLGSGWAGTGVNIATVRRLTDEILNDQVRTSAGSLSRATAFVGLAESVDNLLADADNGLTATIQSFVNSLQGVANDPASAATRQALLSDSRALVARFAGMDQRLESIGDEIHSRLSSVTSEINSLGANIADVNKRLLNSGIEQPHELLDERDRLMQRLAELVQVDSTVQADGTLNVFIGSGQTLVLGQDSAQLDVRPGLADPEQPQIVLRGFGADIDVTRFVTGGELGGMLDFGREVLTPTRAELGRIAVALVTSVNAVHRSGMDADGQLGGDLFAIGTPQTYAASSNAGTGSVAVTIANVAALQPTNYNMTFDGTNYTLLRADNGAVVPMTGAGTVGNPFLAEGLSIVVSGTPATSDQFQLKPLEHMAGSLALLVSRTNDIAAAAPTRTRAELANTGTAQISAGRITDATNASLLSTATIEFVNATTYTVNGAGSFTYTPGADIDINGTRVQITGAPAAGDRFVIESNDGGVGDNRNIQSLISSLGDTVFNGGVTLQGAAASLVTNVGARTAEVTNQRDVQQLVHDQNLAKLESVRGVNLDEEAADMLRFEQLYQAAAQAMSVANNLFNTLLNAMGR